MKILILGAGVIGTIYAWQLSNSCHDVTLFVRTSNLEKIRRDGIHIRCRDERTKKSALIETTYHPVVGDKLSPQDDYDLIIVSVRAHQLEDVLPILAEGPSKAHILFFCQNWWGEEKIRQFLPAGKYLFGFSRLVGGWRTEAGIECILFDNPGLVTMLGEPDGQVTSRLQNLREVFEKAELRPVVSQDILGWLAIHYVEFLGIIGGILKAGSYDAFVSNPKLIKESILATRESFDICKARGVSFKKAAPSNIRIVDNAPVFLLAPLVQMQYRTPSIKQFFEENIEHGMQEVTCQYADVIAEGKRRDVEMPNLEVYKTYYGLPFQSKA
jgi:2-dehydropantoate 2-reductase